MGRRNKKGNPVNGWINLDKPLDLGSTQAVGKVRRFLNAQKVGHAGTLDPLATGILPIALGEATKTIPYMQDALKTYEFTVTWGMQTTTDDLEGEAVKTSDNRPTLDDIQALLPQFTGDIVQIPPQFSAVKIDGERAYDIARSGDTADIKPRQVYVENLELVSADNNTANFRMTCGKGTYVRSLARDMGEILGCYGHISVLRRTAVGAFNENNAISLAKLEEISDSAARMELLLPLEAALDDIPAIDLKTDEMAKLRNGQVLSFISRPDFERLSKAGLGKKEPQTALAMFNGIPVALVENEGPNVKPVRVLNV